MTRVSVAATWTHEPERAAAIETTSSSAPVPVDVRKSSSSLLLVWHTTP